MASNGFWNTSCALPRKVVSADAVEAEAVPPIERIAPALGSTSFSSRRPVVVLPQPDSPSRPTLSPRATRQVDAVDGTDRRASARDDVGDATRRAEMLGETARLDERCHLSLHVAVSRAQVAKRFGLGGAVAGGAVWRRLPSTGSSRTQIASANGQRGAKRQPLRRDEQVGRAALDGNELGAGAVEIGKGVGQAHRVGMERPLQHLVRRAPPRPPAGIHDDDAVADIGDDADVVRHQDHREPSRALQVADDVEHLALHDHVERGHRLVGDHKARIERQRERDRDALAHAAGELVRIIDEAAGIEADHFEELARAPPRLGRAVAAALDQHLLDLRADRVDRIERVHRALRDEGDLAPAHGACARTGRGATGPGP